MTVASRAAANSAPAAEDEWIVGRRRARLEAEPGA